MVTPPPRCNCGRRSPDGISLMKPQATDEWLGAEGGSRWRRASLPGGLQPSLGHGYEGGTQLDAEPVPAQALRHETDGARAEEGVQHDSRLPLSATSTCRSQRRLRLTRRTLPGLPAVADEPPRAGGQHGT